MDIEEIKALVKAGYTKDEIKELETMGAGNEDAPDGNGGATKPDENAGAGGEETGEKNTDTISTDAAIKSLTETVAALTSTVKAMQEKNVAGATGGKPEKSTVDEVLKSFVDTL